jgi:hypothetical protein
MTMSDYPDDDHVRLPGAGSLRVDLAALKGPPPGTLLQGLVHLDGPLECVLDGIRQCQRQGATDAKVKLGATGAASATIWREVSKEPASTEPMVTVPRSAAERALARLERIGLYQCNDQDDFDETCRAREALRSALGET